MAKQYLKQGMKITLYGGPATVGFSCSTADINIEWQGCEKYAGDEGIGSIQIIDTSFNVFISDDGRLVYDDEHGF